MARSAISIAVLFGFVASQMAAMPHAHAFASFAEQHEHDARPHLHVGHSHGHDHDCQGDRDSGDGQRQVPDGCGVRHDGNAIDLPAGSVLVVAKGDQVHQPEVDNWVVIPPIAAASDDADIPAIPWHPPDSGFAARPLFLTLRTLRI